MTGREKLMMAVCAAMGLSASTAAMGQISYTTVGGTYFQDFDTLASTGTTISWTDNSTLLGWYAAKQTPSGPLATYVVGDGSSNSGQVYSFGTTGSSDRALGSVGSGTPVTIYYGMQLVNNTGITLSAFSLSYTGEQWRATGLTGSAAVVNTLSFSYSTTATSISATSGYNATNTLDFKAPDAGSPPGWTGADAAVNGNDPMFQRAISSTVSILGGWAPGASLWLRWTDINDAGNDQGLGIDNLSFSAVPHIPQHNGTTLTVSGSKTPTVVDLGRVVAGQATNTATVNLSNSGGVSTGYADLSTDGSVVTPGTGSVPAAGTTAVTVRIAGAGVPAGAIGSDITRQALVQNTGEDNDTNVTITTKAHVVGNRFVDNYDPNQLGGGSAMPVDFGKMLVGSTKTITGVQLTTVNSNTSDYSSNALTTVLLPAASVTGFAGGTTSGYATATLSAGTNGDVTFDDGNDMDTRNVTLTVIQSGIVKVGALGGERSPGFLSIPLVQLDSAAGASGDARVYVSGDFYAPAAVVGDTTPVAPGGTVTLTNAPPSADSTSGKRLGADILGTSFNQSGWSVASLPSTIGPARAQYTQSSTTFAAVISTATGTISLNTAGKLNGTYGATLSIALQNDQTQGVYGVAANDLPATTVPVSGTVSDKPAIQNGAYTLNGGTLSAPATNLTGSFSQSGGSSTFASVIGGGSINVTGGSLILSAGATTNVVGSLAISGTGKVDLTSAKLAIDYTGGTPSNTIRLALLSGSASGWTGTTGLTSSDAAAHTAALYAIGYAEASLVLGASGGTWNGAAVDGTTLLIKETYFGDANLDGKVNADDLLLLDRGFAKNLAAGTARWTDGDFNYDGIVNSADYLLADTAFGLHGGTLSPDFLADREARFGEAYVSGLVAAVPEPTSLGLVGAAAAGLLGRRRRSGK